MTAIEIYTRPGCGYCTAAKSLLTRKNAAFIELNVANDPAYREAMYDRAGAGTTNVAFGPGEKDLYVSVVKDANDPKAAGSIVRISNSL